MDLATLIAETGPLAPGEVAAIARELAEALDRAHASGLVRGDIHAANVLITGSGTGRLHASLGDARPARGPRSTAPEGEGGWTAAAGSVAPEQVLGQPVDRRTDIYALACVMWEALVGSEPFVRQSEAAARQAHVDDERPHASDIRAGLGERTDEVLQRGMARDPAARHGSAGAFAAELAAALETPARHAPRGWIAPAVGVLLLVLGGAGAWALIGRDEAAPVATPRSTTTLVDGVTTLRAAATPSRPPLVSSGRMAAGLRIRYPAGWRLRSRARSQAAGTVDFELVTIASGPFRRAPMYLRIVAGGRADAAFFEGGSPARLLGRARESARSAFSWKTSFRGARSLRVAGTAGRGADLNWQVEKGYAGLGFAFAARNRRDGRWLYGFAVYDTWDASRVRAGRLGVRRDTLRAVVSSLRWG